MMQAFARRTATLLPFLAVAVVAPAQVSKVGSNYSFLAKLTTGQVIRYRLDTVLNSTAANGDTTGPLTFRILKVRGGVAEVSATVGPFQTTDLPTKPQTFRIRVDRHGQVLKSTPPSETANQLFFRLPGRPIAVGDTWTSQTSVNLKQGTTRFTTQNKFLGLKTLDGREVAAIQVTISGSGAATVQGSGTVFILQKDGTLWSNTTTTKLRFRDKTMLETKLHMYRQ